jgi:hypothetical protein
MNNTSPNLVLTVRDAAYHTVREYPGGARSLGPRVGIDGTYLSQQVNPNNAGRKGLDIDTAVQIQHLAQDYRILHAMALELGHVCIKQSDLDGPVEPSNVMESIGSTVAEFSEFVGAVTESVKDNKVTTRELRDVDKQLGELVQAANNLRGILGSMNDKLLHTTTFGPRPVVNSRSGR